MAEASRPGKRRSTMRTWLENTGLATKKTVSIEHGKWQDFNPADLLAKQSDMLEQMQHIMIEERWQHEQHTRVLETNLENLHKIIESYEKGELSPRSAVAKQAQVKGLGGLKKNSLAAVLGEAIAKNPMPKKPPITSLAGLYGGGGGSGGGGAMTDEERKNFMQEAKKQLARMKEMQSLLDAEKDGKRMLAEAVGQLEAELEAERAATAAEKAAKEREFAAKAVATDRCQRAVQIARQLEDLLKNYGQLPTDMAFKMHVQELHAKLYSIDDELGGVPYRPLQKDAAGGPPSAPPGVSPDTRASIGSGKVVHRRRKSAEDSPRESAEPGMMEKAGSFLGDMIGGGSKQ